MRITLITLFVWTISTIGITQNNLEVLFIGNSYTGVNNLPQMISDLSISMGKSINYDSETPGGYTLQLHASNASTYAKINSFNWDYVVIQAQSQEPSFPDAQVNSQTIPYAIQLADSVYVDDICSEVLFYMTWGRENGDPQWGPISTFDGMNSRLRNAYMRMADSVQGSVSPVGVAWKYVRDNYPTINLYQPDESHPSLEGSYLAACTFYASLFRESPIGASYVAGLGATVALNLQTAAHNAVMDSLDQWNLKPKNMLTQAEFSFNVNGATANFSNESVKALNYSWDFGDGNSSTLKDPQHTYGANGIYTTQLIAMSPCGSDTISYDINISSVGMEENKIQELIIEPVGDGWYAIIGSKKFGEIEIIDIQGRAISTVQLNNQFKLLNPSKSFYFVRVAGMIKRLPIIE